MLCRLATGFGGKQKEKLCLNCHSVARTTGELAARGSLRKYLELNRIKILHNSHSSQLGSFNCFRLYKVPEIVREPGRP